MMQMTMRWGSALLMALIPMVQAQSDEPKKPAGVTDGVRWRAQGQDLRLFDWMTLGLSPQDPQSADDRRSAQYLNDLTNRRQQALFYIQGKGDQGSGLTLAPVDEAARVHLKLPRGQGLIATAVTPEGPAAQAGVCQDDIILILDDAPIGKPEDLEVHLKEAGDKPVDLILLHDGQKKTLKVQPRVNVTFGPVQPAPPEFWIGVSVSSIEPALRAHLKIPADQGLIATDVVADGPAATAGLKANDILLTMAGQPLRDQASLVDLVQKNGEKSVALEIIREGSRQTLQLTPGRRKAPNLTRAPLYADFNVFRPGVVVPGQQSPVWIYTKPDDSPQLNNYLLELYKPNANAAQPQARPQPDRLDGMAAEIKELRKAVEELSKALKDRK